MHKVQKIISRRSLRRASGDLLSQDPTWQHDNQWNADDSAAKGEPRANTPPVLVVDGAAGQLDDESGTSDSSENQNESVAVVNAREEATRAAAAAALRATLRETDELAAQLNRARVCANEVAAAAIAASVCERAVAQVEQEAAIAVAVAEAVAASEAEREAALAAARQEHALKVAALLAQVEAERAQERRADEPEHDAEPPIEPSTKSDEELHHQDVSMQTSLRNSTALESMSKMSASLWRAHMWRTIATALSCA